MWFIMDKKKVQMALWGGLEGEEGAIYA